MTKEYEYEVQGQYEGEYEAIFTATSRSEARTVLDEYRKNAPGISYRIIRKRAK